MVDPESIRIASLFHPFYAEQFARALATNARFVHYTSAEAAMRILQNRALWMRNARAMNDFSEVEYGYRLVRAALDGTIGDRLKRCLDSASPGLGAELAEFEKWRPQFLENTYLLCFSEHKSSEDLMGRLSMWRAYGGDASVALVLNNKPFLSETDVIGAYSSPVLYADRERFEAEFERVARNLENEGPALAKLGTDLLRNRITFALIFATVCTKHPGFAEELEWRAVHVGIYDHGILEKSVEVVRGTPQLVYKLPLKNIPGEDGDAGFQGGEIGELLERLIIGPSFDGRIMQQAAIQLLAEAGIADPHKRVIASGIPLRR